MSRLASNARKVTYEINRFRGINENVELSKSKHGESPHMRNYRVTDAGTLAVRPGILTEQKPFGGMTGAIRGMWCGELGGKESLVYVQGTKLYIKDTGGTHYTDGIDIDGDGDVGVTFFGGQIYVFTGTELYSLDAALTSVEIVEGYVPTVVIAAAADGSGTLYEQVNKLTAKRKTKYSADGKAQTFTLPEACPATVISVQVDNAYITGYTATKAEGSEYVQVKLPTVPAAGTNNVVIEYRAQEEREYIGYSTTLRYGKSGESGNTVKLVQYYDGDTWATLGAASFTATEDTVTVKGSWADGIKWRVVYWTDAHYRREVTSMTAAEIYNGAQDTRIFIYGDGSNKVLYSGLDENGMATAAYFPDLNEIEVGDSNTKITSLIRHKSRLLVFKPTEAYSIYYSLTTLTDGRVTAAYYVNAVNRNVGCSEHCRAVGANNKVYTECYGKIYEWASTNTTGNITADDRNAKAVSDRVDNTVRSLRNSEKRFVFNGLTQELYCLSRGVAVVYSFTTDAWYIYDGLAAGVDAVTAAVMFNDALYFGTSGGSVKRFDFDGYCDTNLADGTETNIKAVWHSAWLDFDRPHYEKYSPRLWLRGVVSTAYAGGAVSVAVSTDRVGGDWDTVTFNASGGEPAISRCIKKAIKFNRYQLSIKTDEDNEHDTITGAVIEASYTIPVK